MAAKEDDEALDADYVNNDSKNFVPFPFEATLICYYLWKWPHAVRQKAFFYFGVVNHVDSSNEATTKTVSKTNEAASADFNLTDEANKAGREVCK